MSASSFRKTFPIREVSAESGTGFDAESDVEKDGKRMRKGANIAITYRYSIDIGEDFAKLDRDLAGACRMHVKHGGKR